MLIYFTGLSEVEVILKSNSQVNGPRRDGTHNLGVIGIMLWPAGLILVSLQGTHFNLQ